MLKKIDKKIVKKQKFVQKNLLQKFVNKIRSKIC